MYYYFLRLGRKFNRITLSGDYGIEFVSIKMYCSVFILLVILQPVSIIAQQPDRNNAFTFSTTVTGDFIRNFKGGIRRGNTYIGIETVSLEFDTKKAGLWQGGSIGIKGLNSHGKGPSELLTGDLQVLSNIEAGDYTGLYELWYQQIIGRFTVLIGLHDLNSEFAGTRYGGTFINSSFGIVPNMSLNMPVSVYPLPAPAAVLKYNPSETIELKYAIYDGDPGDFENNRYNMQWKLNTGQGFLNIGEVDYSLIQNEKPTGTYKLGVFSHTGSFRSYSDTSVFEPVNYGFYFIADQALFSRRLSAAKGLCFFLQGGWAPAKMNMVNWYFGGGLRYHGILPYRYYDEIGLGFAHVRFGDSFLSSNKGYANSETAIELTYKFQLSPNYHIQPSAQYIINPGGSRGQSDCFVGLLRFTLQY